VTEESNLKSARTTLGRHPERGIYDPQQIHDILDEALYCNLGLIRQGVPVVLPTLHVRLGESLYVHGSMKSRLLLDAIGSMVCVSVSLMDALVLARSAFHHSLNYRSVSIYGTARALEEADEKRAVVDALVEHVVPGRLADCRPPTEAELAATLVLEIPIAEASAKVRTGPPIEASGDEELPYWGGLLPLGLQGGEPVADGLTPASMEIPAYLRSYSRGGES
jgi:uncharacterized protein